MGVDWWFEGMMVEYDVAVEYEFCHRCCYCRFSLSFFYCYAAEVGELLENSSHVVMVTKWQCEKWNVNMFFPTSTLFIISLLLLHTLGPFVVVLSFFFVWALHCHCRLFWCLSLCWIFNSNYLASLSSFFYSLNRVHNKLFMPMLHAPRPTHRRTVLCLESEHGRGLGGRTCIFFSRNEECTPKIDSSDENFILKTLEGIFYRKLDKRQLKKHLKAAQRAVERQRRVKNTF